jgi:hypothetical protein
MNLKKCVIISTVGAVYITKSVGAKDYVFSLFHDTFNTSQWFFVKKVIIK